jgi:hypothetical protein
LGGFADCVQQSIAPERAAELRNVLERFSGPGVHLFSEAVADRGDIRLVLYSSGGDSPNSRTLYLAGLREADGLKAVFLHDLKAYLPKPQSLHVVDACLNTLVLAPNLQALHLNVFSASTDKNSRRANDIIFAVPDDGFIRPLLELTNTTEYEKGRTDADSVVLVSPRSGPVAEITWRRSAKMGMGPLAGGWVENTVYQWDQKIFRKGEVLRPEELEWRVNSALRLDRSKAIPPVWVEDRPYGPNDPAP